MSHQFYTYLSSCRLFFRCSRIYPSRNRRSIERYNKCNQCGQFRHGNCKKRSICRSVQNVHLKINSLSDSRLFSKNQNGVHPPRIDHRSHIFSLPPLTLLLTKAQNPILTRLTYPRVQYSLLSIA